MAVWTFLVVTFIGGPMHGESHRILYPSVAACEAATRIVSPTLGYDHGLRCEPTGQLSASVQPRQRPTRTTP
jgi:hypothetical protein